MRNTVTVKLGTVTYSCGHTINRDLLQVPAERREKILASFKRVPCLNCKRGLKAQPETKENTETKENAMNNKNLTDDQIKAIWKNFKKEYKAETGATYVAYMNTAQLKKRTATITIYYTGRKETAEDRSKALKSYESKMALESVKNVLNALGATATFEYSGTGYQYGGPVAKIRLNF